MGNTDNARALTENIAASIATLATATDAAYQDETFRAWLNTAATFHRYSWNNQLLIWAQAPTATKVAGFNTWKQLARNVRKGEKAIHILAPMIGKPKKDDNEVQTNRPKLYGFRSACVFDISQTEGKDIAELETNATEGGKTLLPLLEKVTSELNIVLNYKAISGGAEGYSKGGLIEIEQTLEIPARCGVLAHELCHELLHRSNLEGKTRQQRELEAESVSYVVLTHFGLKPQSHFYLAVYKITAEMLADSLATISSTAKIIIDLCESNSEKKSEFQTGAGEGEPYIELQECI